MFCESHRVQTYPFCNEGTLFHNGSFRGPEQLESYRTLASTFGTRVVHGCTFSHGTIGGDGLTTVIFSVYFQTNRLVLGNLSLALFSGPFRNWTCVSMSLFETNCLSWNIGNLHKLKTTGRMASYFVHISSFVKTQFCSLNMETRKVYNFISKKNKFHRYTSSPQCTLKVLFIS